MVQTTQHGALCTPTIPGVHQTLLLDSSNKPPNSKCDLVALFVTKGPLLLAKKALLTEGYSFDKRALTLDSRGLNSEGAGLPLVE